MGSPQLGALYTTEGMALFVTIILFYTIACVAVGLRIWAKRILRRNFQLHDYLVFGGLFFGLGFGINAILSVVLGATGLHSIEAEELLGPQSIVVTLQTFFSSNFLWITATTLVRLSVLNLYFGIFKRRFFRYAGYVVAGLSVTWCIGYMLASLLICLPIPYSWDRTIPGGSCGNVYDQTIGSATINMLLDFFIVVLPMPVIWNLQLPLRKKVLLSCILSLGLCICAMNVTRVILEVHSNFNDFTYSLAPAAIFAGLELNLGIVCSCAPTLGPLFHHHGSRKGSAYPASSGNRSRWKGTMKSASSQLGGGSSSSGGGLNDDSMPLHTVTIQRAIPVPPALGELGSTPHPSSRDIADVDENMYHSISVQTNLEVAHEPR